MCSQLREGISKSPEQAQVQSQGNEGVEALATAATGRNVPTRGASGWGTDRTSQRGDGATPGCLSQLTCRQQHWQAAPQQGGHTPAEPAAGSGFQVATKAGKGVGWTVTGCRWGTHTSALCNTCGFGQAQVLHQLSPHRWLLLRPSARCFSRRDTQPGAAPESPAALLRIAPR